MSNKPAQKKSPEPTGDAKQHNFSKKEQSLRESVPDPVKGGLVAEPPKGSTKPPGGK